ncbi:MAG: tyrosine--tRNA ligase [Natronincolaceae bacterium]|nr:tyrosine--tRNA ligase [Bacillota bacterium]NLK90074.1 tyrosine--tRNA ligase [Clostridiales bacterium]
MGSVFDTLRERGFIEQATHEDEIRKMLENEKITFYIGFDPTADSLHVGHFVQLMAMAHLQKAGHRPIFLLGAGTAMVGDPSGRTDMRQMMTLETIAHNGEKFIEQTGRFIDFSEGNAIMENNANWLLDLNYVSFIREIGKHFMVNRMLAAECFKNRMEKGLSFLEFNYMIMQAYDFLELFRKYNCRLQLGGDDQWSNIIAGTDLIRRVESETAYGMTFTLLTTSEGNKMGKTKSGAVWLDANKTSPFEFYQYWRNVADMDVKNCLSLLTFLSMDEVERLGSLEGAEINKAKEILAFEVTKLVHGEEEAKKADKAAKALFGEGAMGGSIPSTTIPKAEFVEGMDIITLLSKVGLIPSRGEGRRLIQQGGITINDGRVSDISTLITLDFFENDTLMIRKGKKTYHQVVLDDK